MASFSVMPSGSIASTWVSSLGFFDSFVVSALGAVVVEVDPVVPVVVVVEVGLGVLVVEVEPVRPVPEFVVPALLVFDVIVVGFALAAAPCVVFVGAVVGFALAAAPCVVFAGDVAVEGF